MSQHDYNIANGGGAAVRADINAALTAIQSINSGATAPAATKPYMPWYDTAAGVIKFRNALDTDWVTGPQVDASGNVGIGTSSPTERLGVLSALTGTTAGSNTVARLQANGSGYDAHIAMGDNVNASTRLGYLSGAMYFWTNAAERMRIDTSGNVGVGMTPTNFGNGYTVLQVANASNGGMLYLTNTANAGGRIFGNAGGITYDAFSTAYHAFNTNGSERARIDSSGNLLVGTTSSSATAGATGYLLKMSSTGPTSYYQTNSTESKLAASFYNPNGQVGYILTSGSGTTYATSSDYRLKEAIAPMTGALAKVALLKPCTYKWKRDGSDGQGFIAHELAEVEAGCVTGEKDATSLQQVEVSPAVPATFDADGNELTPSIEAVFEEREVPQYQGIDTSFLVATLTAAIQELKAIVDAQSSRLSVLEQGGV